LNNPLLARYAECVFWLSRFVERAENLARILEVNETHARDRGGARDWLSIVHINSDEAAFSSKHARPSADAVIGFYVTDASNPTSIVSAVANARENARTLRPLVSTEMWVQLNVFHNRLKAIAPAELVPGALSALLTEIKEACQTFAGITEGTFYRDQAWYFYQLGKYVERADQTTRLLDTKYKLLTRADDGDGPDRIGQWHALLRSASGYHAFRRIHSSDLTPARVVGFLLFNPNFPRSVYLCVREIDAALYDLKLRFGVRAGNDVAEALDTLRAILAGRSTEEVLGGGLHDFLDFVQSALIDITDRLSAAFFGQAPPPAQAQTSAVPTAIADRAQIASWNC
jgi:uncharacterized alpha-E superfamily protein